MVDEWNLDLDPALIPKKVIELDPEALGAAVITAEDTATYWTEYEYGYGGSYPMERIQNWTEIVTVAITTYMKEKQQ